MITGQESALAQLLIATITSAVEAKFGGPVQPPEYIDALSIGIANALIPFLTINIQVNATQSVTVPGLGLLDSVHGAVTGIATGTVSTTGNIS